MLNKYIFNIPIDNNTTILYNSITSEVIELNNTELYNIQKKNYKHNDTTEYLKENLYLEDNNLNYKKIIETLKNNIKYSSRMLSFTIHLNYSCNLRCSYCYQDNISNKISMSNKSQNEIICFIEKVILETSPLLINITFIGGEPLLYKENLINILSEIKNYIKNNNIKIFTTVVTNGTLLTSNLITELDKLGVDLYQITLDGPKKIHDKFRFYSDGNGSYEIILKNLKDINSICNNKICINCNISSENVSSIEELLVDLKANNINFPIIFSLVFECRKDMLEYATCNKVVNDDWLRVHKLALKYNNFYTPFYRMSYLTCGINKTNNFIISPDGYLYKCLSGIGDKRYLVSHVNEYGTYSYINKISQYIEKSTNSSQCNDCKYMVVCGGGCEYKKNINGFYCYKDEIEINDIPLIAYNYKEKIL